MPPLAIVFENVPDPLPTQVPFTAKQPDVRLMPVPNVEVAVLLMLIVFAPVPPSERSVPGVVVPMPMLPLLVMTKLVALEDPTTNAGAEPFVAVGLIDTKPHGEVVPKLEALLVPLIVHPAPKSDDVASAVGTAEPLVLLARIEFAAIAARPIVALEPPTSAPAPPEIVIPLFVESVVVATDESAFEPLP